MGESTVATQSVSEMLTTSAPVSSEIGRTFYFSGTIGQMETRITSFKELEAEAARFLSTLAPSSLGATLVTLSGELGAGKTAFVKAIALTLGVPDTVTSPTFVLEKIYVLPPNLPFKRLIHIDAYRLEKSNNLNALGFSELMKSSDNLVMLEWPEKVQDALPQPAAHLSFLANEDESRTITYG